jgi:hypothetical protein
MTRSGFQSRRIFEVVSNYPTPRAKAEELKKIPSREGLVRAGYFWDRYQRGAKAAA